MKKVRTLHLLMIIVLVLLASCGSPQEVTTPTVEPTTTPIPTPSAEDFIDKGSKFLDSFQYSEAEQAFQTAIELDPDSATAHAKLAMTYFEQEIHFEEMLAEAQRAVELDPENGYNLAVLANVQEYQLQFEEALQNAEAAYKQSPENDFVARSMAYLYLWNSDYDKAWEVLEQLLVDFPDDARTFKVLGDYFFQIAEFGTARAAYLRAAELDPENLYYKGNLAYLTFQREDYDQAVTLFEEILAEDPENEQALMAMIDIHLARSEFDLAAENIEQFSESNPEDYRLNTARGDWLFYQNEYTDAIVEYKKALEINPFLIYPQFRIGYSYMYQDECERARSHFQELMEEHPQVLTYQIGEADTDMCTGRIDQAIRKLKDVIEEDPYLTGAYLSLGYAYTLQSRWEDAEEAHSDALAFASYPSIVHQSIASMLNYQGFAENAEMELLRAIELNSYNFQAYTDLTFILLEQDRFSEASETVQKAAEINPEDAGVLYAQGISNYLAGNFNESIKAMEHTLDLDPEYYYAHLFIGLARRSLGQYEEARTEIENYMGLMGSNLPDGDEMYLSVLLDSLNNGYTLTDDEVLDSINEFLVMFDLTDTNPKFETFEDQGKTLIFNSTITRAELENELFMFDVGIIMAVNAFYLPRVTPPADGGVLINVKISGRDAFTVEATASLIQQYADTLITVEDLISGLSYTMFPDYVRGAAYNRIISDVSALRELPLKHVPPQKVISRDDLKEETADGIDQKTQEKFDQTEAMLALLEVIPTDYDYTEGTVDMYGENIAGYYVPSEDQIYVVEEDQLSQTDQLVLAHESTHALQYQHHDMGRFDDPTLDDDQQLAFLSLIEGDATLSSVLYLNEYIPTVEQLEIFSSFADFDDGDSQNIPNFMIKFLSFPYDYGFEFVSALYDKGGWEEVNLAYENPPVSSEQILHPESYFENDVPLNVDLSSPMEKIGEKWIQVDQNVMGEYGIYLILEEYFGPYAAYEATHGWGGDQYVLLQNTETDSYAFLMQIDWDGPDEAKEFWNSFKVAMEHRNQYQQIIDEFVLDPVTRLWYDEENFVLVHLDSRTTYLFIGEEKSDLEQILAVVLE